MKKQTPTFESFNAYAVIGRLRSGDALAIHTIPGEEWTLSCYLHKTLLVDVYVLTGQPANAKKPVTHECGQLAEVLLKLLVHGRKAKYRLHASQDGVISFAKHSLKRINVASIENDVMAKLRGGDLIFRAIPDQSWILSNTCFGQWSSTITFYLAEEDTLGTPNVRMYRDTHLDHLLLEFLSQQSTFAERASSKKVLDFKKQEVAE